uniref:Chromo domain-containing protein n=1 Tax=Panagrolaimus davidi TaxID=227884 RepID=A0A914QU46_9BILA
MSLPKVIQSDSESSDSNESESSTELSEEEFEVEKLVGKRIEKGVLKYKVRWVGYDATDDTWENVDNLNCPAKIAEYERELEQKKATKRASRSRTASRSSQYMDTSNENVTPKLSNAAKRLKSTTPSGTVKAENVPSPSSSKKIPKETATSKTAPSKASINVSGKSTPFLRSSSHSKNLPSTSKKKTGTLFDKNPSGARAGMTSGQREFYKSSADFAFIFPDNPDSLFNNLVNKLEPSANDNTPTPSTLVKISETLSKNPPILNDEITVLAGSILSNITPSSSIKIVNPNNTPTTSKSNKTVNNDASTTDKRSPKSKTGAKATSKSPADRTKIVTPLPPSRTATPIVPSPTTAADEATATTSVPIASTSSIISPQSINPAAAASEEETLNVRNKSITMEKITASAAAPVTKNKSAKKENDDLRNRLWNMATTNSNEASIGIVEGRPLNIAESAADTMNQPVIPIIPADHQCFGNSPTILEFAKRAVIHNVNNQKMEKVFSKTWKMRCTECTEKYTVNDSTVEFGYCILTVGSSASHFMIKLNKCDNELFLIDSDKFKSTCPKSYGFFVCITREFFDTLGDLDLAIEEQKDVVKKCFNNSLLKPYKENGTVDFSILQTCPSEIMKAVREIGRLFFLELQLAIGRYMCTVVDISELYKFVMDFYEKREKLYAIVRKEAVENIYETLFMSLISESAES